MKITSSIKNLCIFTFLIFLATFGYADETFVALKKNKVNVRYGPSFESDIKYEGYIKRHKKEIATLKKSEHLRISPDLTFSSVPGISKEAEEKLELVKPENLGQARRVSGVTPADVSALHVFLSK